MLAYVCQAHQKQVFDVERCELSKLRGSFKAPTRNIPTQPLSIGFLASFPCFAKVGAHWQ